MTAFWLLAALLVAACMAWLLAPLLRAPRTLPVGAAPEAEAMAALQRYRAEIAELDDAKREGVLDDATYTGARRALDRRLLDECPPAQDGATVLASPAHSTTGGHSRSPLLAGLLLAALPAGAILLYLQLGNPLALVAADRDADGMPGTIAGNVSDDAQAGHAASNATVEAMVARLAFRLRDAPDDAQGWYMLARSYAALERFGDAAAAYGRAVALVPDSAMLRADYADALASAGGGTLEGLPLAQIEAALRLDPEEPKALALAASAAVARGDIALAIGYWERLQRLLPPDSRTAERVAANLSAARTGMLAVAADAPARPSGTGAPRAAGSDMPRGQPDAASGSPATPASATISGTVVLAASGGLQVRPGDTLYVIARPTDGSRMPLAVWRQKIDSLPVAFTLDDTLAMTPERPLSGQREVLLEARLSASGKAMPQAGDRVGKSGAASIGSTGVRIVIDAVVPGG